MALTPSDPVPASRPATRLRPHRPGDLGWIVGAHGRLYHQEFGWDIGFEALVARIAADFIERFDATREACWIAERLDNPDQPQPVGSVVLVQARNDDDGTVLPGVAQLRLLLLTPEARGLGLGRQLVAACTDFARQAGYQRLRLWTQSHLLAARHLYAQAGYRCLSSEPHHSFGHDMVAEIWELELDAP